MVALPWAWVSVREAGLPQMTVHHKLADFSAVFMVPTDVNSGLYPSPCHFSGRQQKNKIVNRTNVHAHFVITGLFLKFKYDFYQNQVIGTIFHRREMK